MDKNTIHKKIHKNLKWNVNYKKYNLKNSINLLVGKAVFDKEMVIFSLSVIVSGVEKAIKAKDVIIWWSS